MSAAAKKSLHFDVSTGLKRVLGRELITDDEVAIFELVKNSFDAGANTVHLHFGKDRIIVADNGSGMTYEDLTQKWLFVAYSSKRTERPEDDFRNVAADRRHFAGSKGIGRFSSDRLGKQVVVQSRAAPASVVQRDLALVRAKMTDDAAIGISFIKYSFHDASERPEDQ